MLTPAEVQARIKKLFEIIDEAVVSYGLDESMASWEIVKSYIEELQTEIARLKGGGLNKDIHERYYDMQGDDQLTKSECCNAPCHDVCHRTFQEQCTRDCYCIQCANYTDRNGKVLNGPPRHINIGLPTDSGSTLKNVPIVGSPSPLHSERMTEAGSGVAETTPSACIDRLRAENQKLKSQNGRLVGALERVGNRKMWYFDQGLLEWAGESEDGNEIETMHPVEICEEALAAAKGDHN